MVMLAFPAFARDFYYKFEGQILEYTVINEESKTCRTREGSRSYPGNRVSGDLTIPATVSDGTSNYTVTEIGEYSFSQQRLTSVEIPNSVTYIEREAFSSCSGLTEVTIPSNVRSIGAYAFWNCDALKVIYFNAEYCSTPQPISSGVTDKYGNVVHASGAVMTSFPETLSKVIFGETVKKIPEYGFWDCSGLSEVIISSSVTEIGKGAFQYCESLASVNIPDSVTMIGNGAFFGCKGLSSITFPNSVTEIGSGAFSNCSALSSIEIPNSVTEIGESSFA